MYHIKGDFVHVLNLSKNLVIICSGGTGGWGGVEGECHRAANLRMFFSLWGLRDPGPHRLFPKTPAPNLVPLAPPRFTNKARGEARKRRPQ